MRIIFFFVLIALSCAASAQCFAPHGITGQSVLAYEKPGQTIGNAYATATWSNGWPTITYAPKFYNLPSLFKEFVKLHECAHVSVPTLDEIQANCIALLEMRRRGLSWQEEQQIARWTASAGLIGFQYGGTGANFWLYTIQCAGPR